MDILSGAGGEEVTVGEAWRLWRSFRRLPGPVQALGGAATYLLIVALAAVAVIRGGPSLQPIDGRHLAARTADVLPVAVDGVKGAGALTRAAPVTTSPPTTAAAPATTMAPTPPPPRPATSSSRSSAPTTSPAPRPAPIVAAVAPAPCDRACVRRPGPTRVLFIGDSVIWQVDRKLTLALRARGFEVGSMTVPGTGLVTGMDPHEWVPKGFTWVNETRALAQKFDPDVVVAEFVGVYNAPDDGSAYEYGSPAFVAAWARATDDVMANFAVRHAIVHWVLAPPMRDPPWSSGVNITNQIYRDLAQRWPRSPLDDKVQYVDAITPLAAPDGTYADHVADADGLTERVRTDDGVHLTEAGQRRFVDQIVLSLSRYSFQTFRAG